MKFVHGRIVRYRKDAKLNRAGLARLMQVKAPTLTPETIRNWETGRNRPSDEYFNVLCHVLKKRPKDFYDF